MDLGLLSVCFPVALIQATETSREASRPFASVEIVEPYRHLERAITSRSVRSFLDSSAVRAVSGQSGSVSTLVAAGLKTASSWFPRRIRLTVSSATPRWLGGAMRLGLLIEALEATREMSAKDAETTRRSLTEEVVGGFRDLRELGIRATIEFATAATGRYVFNLIDDAVTEAIEAAEVRAPGLPIERGDNSLAVTLDLGAFDAAELRELLVYMGVEADSQDAAASPVLPELAELAFAFSVTRTDNRLDFELRSRGFEFEATPATTGEPPMIAASWHLGDWLHQVERYQALEDRLLRSKVASHLSDGDREATEWWREATAMLPDHGRLAVTTSTEGVEVTLAETGSGREVEIVGTGLLERAPIDTEFRWISGHRNLVESAIDAVDRVLDRLEYRALADDLVGGDRANDAASYRTAAKTFAGYRRMLGGHRDRFSPGLAVIASTDGWWGAAGEQSGRHAPAVAVIARPETTNAGLLFARELLEAIAGALGGTLELGDDSMTFKPASADSPVGPGVAPHAFVIDDLLVISTSTALSDRIRRGGYWGGADAQVSMLRTSGRRLTDLAAWSTSLAYGVLSHFGAEGSSARAAALIGTVLRGACSLFGSIRSDTEQRDGELVTRTSIEFAELESARHPEILESIRRAIGPVEIDAGSVLIGRGNGQFLGTPTEFEFGYGSGGRFRETIETPGGFDIAWDGHAFVQDDGWGRIAYRGTLSGFARGWAAAVTGDWLRRDSEFVPKIVDITPESIAIALTGVSDHVDPRIVIDARTLLPRRYDRRADLPLSQPASTELFDFRRVGRRMLPTRIVVAETATTTEYRIDDWSLEELDGTRFSPGAEPAARFAQAEGNDRIEFANGEIFLEARVGSETGWIAMLPLQIASVIDESLVAPLVAAGARWHESSGQLFVERLEAGPIRADNVRLNVARFAPREDRRVIGYLGTEALQGCCVAFDLDALKIRLLPPGSFEGDGFRPMCSTSNHRVFECELRGGVRSWFAPFSSGEADVYLKPFAAERLARASAGNRGPLAAGGFPWIEVAGRRVEPTRTTALDITDPLTGDDTPIAIGWAAFKGKILELDFPNARYRFVSPN